MILKYICDVFESVKRMCFVNGQIGIVKHRFVVGNMYQHYIELNNDNRLR